MWKIEYYTTNSGRSPTRNFVLGLQPPQKAKVINAVNLLKEFGPYLKPPHSKKLSAQKRLFELRTTGKSPIRLLYYHIREKFIILHGFIKKSSKIPAKDIAIAISRMQT